MVVELTKGDLINLLRGTGGPHSYEHPFNHLGTITGFPNERWQWNYKALVTMDEDTLYENYR